MENVTNESSVSETSPEVKTTASPGAPLRKLIVLPTGGTSVGPLSSDAPKRTEADIARAAKSFESVVDKIIGVLDATSDRIITYRFKKLVTPEQLAELVAECELKPDSRDAGKLALSRIAARRVTNPEVMDWIALGGMMTDWLTGITIAFATAREIEADKLKQNGNAKSKN